VIVGTERSGEHADVAIANTTIRFHIPTELREMD
jgi:hypothetical protein